MSVDRPRTWNPRRLADPRRGAALVAAVAVGAFAVWFVFFSAQAPGAATIDDAAGVICHALTVGGATATAIERPERLRRARPRPRPAGDRDRRRRHLDGRHVARLVRRLHQRVGRLPRERGPATRSARPRRSGRTPDVAGTLTLTGTTLQSGNHRGRPHDDPERPRRAATRRSSARSRRAASRPRRSSSPSRSTSGRIPADGQTVTVDATGTLTIHGTARRSRSRSRRSW